MSKIIQVSLCGSNKHDTILEVRNWLQFILSRVYRLYTICVAERMNRTENAQLQPIVTSKKRSSWKTLNLLIHYHHHHPFPIVLLLKQIFLLKKCHFVLYLDTCSANEMTTVYRSWFWFQMVSVVWAWLILPWQCLCSVKWRTTVAGMYWTAVTHSSLAVATTKYEIRGYICYINFPYEIHLIFEMWNFIPCKKFITIADNKTFLLK